MPPTLSEVFEDEQLRKLAVNHPTSFKFPVAPVMRVASDAYPPHVFVTEYPNGTWTQRGGLITLFNMLAQSMNFTYELIRPPDGAWGQLGQDGSWSGMIGMLVRKEVDLALGPFATTYNRAQVVTFTPSIVLDPLCVIAGRLNPKANPWGFAAALGNTTWLGILLSLLGFTVALTAVSRRGRADGRGFIFRYQPSTPAELKRIVEGFIDNMSEEDVRKMTNHTKKRAELCEVSVESGGHFPVRTLLGAWLLFVLVLMKSFTGALVSLLAVQNVPIEFRDLQDIISHPSVKVIIEENSVVTELFRTSNTGTIGEVGKFYEKNRFVEASISKFYNLLETEVAGQHRMILVAEHLMAATFFSRNFGEYGYCKFYLIPECFLAFKISMALAKDSLLEQPFKSRILRYHSMGFYDSFINKELINASSCYSLPKTISQTQPYDLKGLWVSSGSDCPCEN
ncbi:Ionotropic glutamate receptor L-glutamate and glycine-binding domain [Trinorchestia longiramus]|nr:Ionotropic glutamate receptor L-glutamate and glycine-binding domain [Trinorchestia longiramus]